MTKEILLSKISLCMFKSNTKISCRLCRSNKAGTNFIVCRGHREYEGIYDICDDCRLQLLNKLPCFCCVHTFRTQAGPCVECSKKAGINVWGYVPLSVRQCYITVSDKALGVLSLYIDNNTVFLLRLCSAHLKERISPEAFVNYIKGK
jgi:hypothetical protein